MLIKCYATKWRMGRWQCVLWRDYMGIQDCRAQDNRGGYEVVMKLLLRYY